MTDPREAAESIVNCVIKAVDDTGPTYTRDERKFCFGLAEPYELAAAYLAEHPEDDGEPITEDWLRTQFKYDGNRDGWDLFQFPGDPVRIELELGSKGYMVWLSIDEMRPVPIKLVPTRGDLRRLLGAITKEGK